MKKRNIPIRFVLIGLLFWGCKKNNCFDNIGTVEVMQRDVPAFEEIAVYDNINLLLVQDTANRVDVEAGTNQQPSLAATVQNNRLILKYEVSCHWLRDAAERVNVTVHLKSLKKLLYEGYGAIRSLNALTGERLIVTVNGGAGEVTLQTDVTWLELNSFENADLTVSGKCYGCVLIIGAQTTIDLRRLVARYMRMDYRSIFNGYVHVTDSLTANLYYKGNVYYTGNPVVTLNRYSDGRLITY